MTDPVEQLKKRHNELNNREIILPWKPQMIRSVAWISNPNSVISRAFLPGLVEHAGTTTTALGLTGIVVESYNKATNILKPADSNRLLALLDAYPTSLIIDKETGFHVQRSIAWIVDQAILQHMRRA